jgi:hypothetical protein
MSEKSKTMATSIKLCLLAVLGVTAGMASSLCTAGTYDTYVALGSGGCSLGGETFSNFSLAPSFTNSLGVPTLANDQILITPTTVGNTEALAFSYETMTGAPLIISLTDSNQVFAFSFGYVATPGPTTSLSSIQMTSTFSNTTPGSVSATKNGQALTGGTLFTSAVADNGMNNVSNTYLGPVTAVTNGTTAYDIRDAISLQAQTGSVTDSGFANDFVTSVVTTTTPEPPASLLIGGGLLLISSLVRRVSRNKRMNV